MPSMWGAGAQTRRAAAIALLLGAACAAACTPPPIGPQAPVDLSTDERHVCAVEGASVTDAPILLAGVDADVRSKIELAVRKRHVVALHVERRDCNLAIDVLECTRPAGYLEARHEAKRAAVTLTRAGLRGAARDIAGAATLLTMTRASAIRIEPDVTATRNVSWWQDLVAERMRSRFGRMREGAAPTLFADELEGADCNRATHWAQAIDYGRFSARGGDASQDRWEDPPVDRSACLPKPCVEPIGLRLVAFEARGCPTGALPDGSCADAPASLRETNGLALLRRVETHPCPESGGGPIPGPPSADCAAAYRHFDAGDWARAAEAAARVVGGETPDDEGNRWSAEYVLAVSYARLHHDVEAAGVLSRIALTRCHPQHDEAAFWMTVVERRALR